MRAVRLWLCLTSWLLLVPLLHAGTVDLSLHEYTTQLKQIRQQVSDPKVSPSDASAIVKGLPSSFTLQSDAQQFTVAVNPIADDLRKFATSHDEAALEHARRRIDLMLADAEGMNAAPVTGTGHRVRLNEILARREFHEAAGETWWDRLKRRVQRFLWDALGAMFASPAFPVVSRAILWAVIVLSLLLLVYWVVRDYRESGTFTNLAGIPGTVSERPWRDWQTEARLAAEQGRWRDAIHLSYWAGISFLEGQGLWRPDRARTPREYLSLLQEDDTHWSPLAELTREFETIWYGGDQANEQTFVTASILLERLGCR
jgi:hypothetical protein